MASNSSTTSKPENGEERKAILASIRSSLAASVPFDAVRGEHQGHQADVFVLRPTVNAEISRKKLVENFCSNLKSVGGNFTLVPNETEAANRVRAIIEKIGAKRIAISNSDLIARMVDIIRESEFIKNAPPDVLFECDLGITSAQWAIAETGTLVLESEKESHRLTSLVPPVHLCIVNAANIRQSLAEILELTGKDLSRTMTFITGASRTSDIELTLAIGVHGPAELHVIVIADE